MRVALIQAPAWGALPSLGPACLKAYLQERGHEARCFDLNIEFFNAHESRKAKDLLDGASYGGPDPWGADSYGQWALDYDAIVHDNEHVRFQQGSMYNDEPLPVEAWAEEILAYEPQVVGFTVYLTSFTSSLLLAREITRRDPSVTIVFGGPNVASDREGDIALRTKLVTAIVDGEGEETLFQLLEALEHHIDLTRIAGLGLLVDGQPHWTERRPLIKDIDTLPLPDFSDSDWTVYPNPFLIPIMASRGCVLNCAFCYETVYWKRFRTMGPKRIVDEIQHQIDNHPYRDQASTDGKRFYFMFGDSLVNGHLKGLQRMCDELIARDLPVHWGGQARMDKRMTEEICQKLADSGCTGLAFGLESGSQAVLETMGKHYSIDDAEGLIHRFHQAGMSATINVMVGFPTESRRDFVDTLLFLFKVRKWIYQVSNVTTTQIALGSDLAVHPEKYGVTVHPDGSWESPETGTEKDRQRRLKVLHRWMQVLRIPHQNMAPD